MSPRIDLPGTRLAIAAGLSILALVPLLQPGCLPASGAGPEETVVEESSQADADETLSLLSTLDGTELTVSSTDSGAEIMPISPDLLGSPPAGVTGDLGVLMVGPQGEQLRPMQAVVIFDRPMVPLSDLDTMIASVPIECGPELNGKVRWAGTSTAVWIPEDTRFPMASEFQCTIPRGTASLDGASLSEDLSWTFQTPTLKLTDGWPRNNSSEVGPDENILLVFNQSVDPEKLRRYIRLENDEGVRLTYDIETPTEALNWRYPSELTRSVVIDAQLKLNTEYTIVIDRGARGLEGTRGTEGTTRHRFKTVPPPAILRHFPKRTDVSPYDGIEIELRTETDGTEIGSKIHISPEPPEWNPSRDWSSRWWRHGALLEPMTTYTVTVDPGFKDIYGQVYTEGVEWSFSTGHFDPLIDVTQSVEIYPANNPSALPLRSRNLKELHANVVAVDSDWLLDNRELVYSDKGHPQQRGERFDFSDEVKVNDRLHIHEIDLSAALNDGHGVILVEVWSPEVQGSQWNRQTRTSVPYTRIHRSVLQVTNLGATVKIGANGIQTWVTDLEDGNPVADAQVEIIRAGTVQWNGNSDTRGLTSSPDLVPPGWNPWKDPIWVRVTKGSDQVLTSAKLGHELDTWDYNLSTSSPNTSESIRSHSFTDRGVYKQGEVAHVALSVRITTEEGLRLPVESSYSYICTDSNGSEMARGEDLSMEAHGGASFDVQLPADMSLGSASCGMDILADGFRTHEYVYLPVHAYRVPAFRVDVDGPENAISGDNVAVQGNGRYLFGAPMAHAEASWSVRSSTTNPNPDGWEDFHFGAMARNWWDYDYDDWGYRSSQLIDSGNGALDDNGQLSVALEIPTTEEPTTRVFTYEVAVTDAARQQIANRTQVMVHPSEAYVGLKQGEGIGKAGSNASFEYVLVDPEGRVLSGEDVEVKISRRSWNSIRQKGLDGRWNWSTNTVDEEVQTLRLRSRSKSQIAKWKPEQGGLYVLEATARDDAGRLSRTQMQVYVAGSGASWARGDSNKVELVPDRRSYQPGDVASILVKAPRAGMKALITVEREGVRHEQVRTLDTNAETIEVAIAEDAIPNLFVSVILVEGAPPNHSPEGSIPSWYMGYTKLSVEPVGKHLEVIVETDSSRYGPGDTVETTVRVERDGKPVPDAHVVLYAVDYGVLSLTGYQTPDAFDGYYQHLPLRVLTHDSRTRILDRGQYLAKGARPGGGGAEETGDGLRERFVTTPLWKPDLVTGSRGSAEVSFELPDNLTTFQLMAVVDAGADSFGSGEHQVIITREVIARPALPRFFRTGDEAMAGVVVHNNTDDPLHIDVTAESWGIDLAGAPTSVDVPAGGAVEVPFALTNPQEGEAVFRFEAEGGGHRDAVKWTIPVIRPQPVETVATASSTRDVATEQIGPLNDVLADVGGLEISVSPTVLVGADSSLDYLIDYPHGCLEQTTSKLLAAVLARELQDRVEIDYSDEALSAYVEAGLSKLNDFEHYSGGYSYWPSARYAAPVATAYAVEAQARAGKTVGPEKIKFLREFMNGKHNGTWWSYRENLSARVRVALSLARLGHGDPGFNSNLFSLRTQLSLTSKAELLEAIALTSGSDGVTKTLLREIEAATYVEASITRIRDPDSENSRVLWASDLTATAAAVSAIVAAYPKHPLLERLTKGLVRSRKGGYWYNTYTTLKSFSALADYAQDIEGDISGTEVELVFAGKSLLSHAFEKPRSTTAEVAMGTGLDGELQVSASGGLVYYEARLSYGREEMPPRDEGFTLVRKYTLLEGTGDGSRVTPGAVVQIDLRIVTPIGRTNVAIIDPLPAGLEPINQAFKTTAHTDMNTDSDDLRWSSWVFDHREMDDDEMRLYATYMPAGVHTFSYLARATTPGEYALPAATVEEMYRPENFGRTEQGRFTVGSAEISRAD